MVDFTDPDAARAYLNSVSDHPKRLGDTSYLHPQFAIAMANAIHQARAAGVMVRFGSGYRSPDQLVNSGDMSSAARFDANGNSAHSYGVGGDVAGLPKGDGSAFLPFATANGLSNPYGIKNAAEYNHFQLPPRPLPDTPELLGSLKTAAKTGNMSQVWNAFDSASGSTATAPVGTTITSIRPPGTPTPFTGDMAERAAFIQDYAKQIGLDPNLALGIARAEGLNTTAKGPERASTVDIDPKTGKPFSFGDFQLSTKPGAMGADALSQGIDPSKPEDWKLADAYAMNRMLAGGVKAWTDPFARQYAKTGVVPAVPPIPTGGGADAAPAAAPAAPPNPFTAFAPGGAAAPGGAVATSLTDLDKALGGQQPGQKQQGGQAPEIGPSPMIPGPGAVNVSPLFNPMLGQQMMAQLSRAPAPPAQQAPIGTTLNSMAMLDTAPVQFAQVYPSQMGYGGMGSMSMGGYPSSGGYGYGG